MYDWKEMAKIVGRKFVENGQERILQRIFEGLNSGFVLDISDFKESQEHKLLHLVWRKFPRNYRPPTDGQRTIISHSTQTEGVSGPGLNKISKITNISDADCFSATDMRGLFDANESPAISESLGQTSDAGWTSDCSLSSTDLVAQEAASFKHLAKGRSSKPNKSESKSQTELNFKCLEDTPENDDTLGESGRKSPLIGFGGNRIMGKKSRRKKKNKTTAISVSKGLSTENSPLDAPSSSGSGGVIPPSEVPVEVKDAKQQATDTALYSLFQKATYLQDKVNLLNSALAEAKRPP